MAMYGCVRSGLVGRTSTRSGLTPPCQLNNLLRQNTQGLSFQPSEERNRWLSRYLPI
jgi:hypothetical protein